jgi:DNA replication and repair protein RecF
VLTARDPTAERRSVRLDGGAERGQQALAEILGVLWLTPADDRLFLAGPGDRRRFLDRLVLGVVPGHGAQVAAYERQLRERAALLREGRGDAAWLTVLERRVAEAAVAVAAARREVVAGLTAELDVMDQDLARPRLALAGEVEAELERLPALAAEQRLAERLRRARPADALMGGATHGPHRTDLLVADARSGQPAAQCSTGQHKALLVAILLAEARLRLASARRIATMRSRRISMRGGARRCSSGWSPWAPKPGSPAPMPPCSRPCAAAPSSSPSTTPP